jgi:chromosome segregation ATPase
MSMRGNLYCVLVAFFGLSAPAFSAPAESSAAPPVFPVCTNIGPAVCSNEVDLLTKQVADIDAESLKVADRESRLKADYRELAPQFAACVTNVPASDEEAVKLKQRLDEINKEARDIRLKLESRLAGNPDYKASRGKLDAVREELQAIQIRKDELRKARMSVTGRIWQLRRLDEMATARTKIAATNDVPPPPIPHP